MEQPIRSNLTPLIRRAGKKRASRKNWIVFILIIVLCSSVVYYQTHKPLPVGISMEGPVHRVKEINFLYDLTYKNSNELTQEPMIFERMFKAIEDAEQFIVIDMFLFNGYYKQGESYPPLSQMLSEKLIAQKKKYPAMNILFISDPINTGYGSYPAKELELLQVNGIKTVLTDVDPLRDSSPLYSGMWRMFVQWFGQSGTGWITNPMADTAPKLTVRSELKMLNVKANHRKVLATEKTLIVPSANPHDASAYNSNTAFEVQGDIIGDALTSEQAVIRMSGSSLQVPPYTPVGNEAGEIEVRLLTEGKILKHVLSSLSNARDGETIWMGMFYLADRQVIHEILKASERGVSVYLILDPNENAFGNHKIGLPNRPVAAELLEKSNNKIQVRWYNTTKEQYHTKLLFIDKSDGVKINNGSANFTTRNLDDLNLETNLDISSPRDNRVAQEIRKYFTRLWNNEGAVFTLDYEAYEDKMIPAQKMIYTLQRYIGYTTF